MIATAGSLRRGARNVLRNPVRLVLVVVLLGASLTFTAAMVSLNAGAQNQIAKVRQQVGTGITITPPFSGFQEANSTLSAAQIHTTTTAPHVIGSTESASLRYQGTNLYGTAKLSTAFQQGRTFRFPGSSGGTGSGRFPGGGSSGGSSSGPTFRHFVFNTAKGGTIEPTVTGITGGAAKVTLSGGGTVKMGNGRDLTTADAKANVGLMSVALAKANKLDIGSTFTLKGTKVKLIGLFTTGNTFTDNGIIVPLNLADKVFGIKGATSLTAYVDTAGHVNGVAALLQKELGSGTNVVTQNQFYQTTFSALDSTSNNIKSALIASIITAALVIVFAVFIIVRERTREIGVLKAIGASSTNIVAQFTAEVVSLSVSAAVAAAVMLAVFGGQIAKAFNISTVNAAGSAGSGGPPTRFGGGFAQGGSFVPRFLSSRSGGGGGRTLPLNLGSLNAGLSAESLLILLGLAVLLAVVASWIPTWYVSRVRPARVLSNA
jgi:putative ABC transport system permease protein